MRKLLRILNIAALALGISFPASDASASSNYPDKMVRIVVPFPAGSMTDILARIVGDKLGMLWHQSVIVENRNGLAGTASVAKSAPDGYTIMLTSNGHTVIGKLNSNLNFDPIGDFIGVSKIASMPLTLVISPQSSATSLADIIKLAKDAPGSMTYASAGVASTSYIASELLKKIARVDILHVPYRASPTASSASCAATQP